MYHEITYAEAKRRNAKRIVTLVVAIALIVAAVFAVRAAQVKAREQAVVTVRESVLNAAKQCCAVEGSYPPSLAHLEREYGLVINRDDYVVSYEWFADNVLPSVVVTAR